MSICGETERRADALRRRHRRRVHRHAGLQRASSPRSMRDTTPAAARRSSCRCSRRRCTCWSTSPQTCWFRARGGGRYRQRPCERRALHDLQGARCDDGARGRQRRPVRPMRRRARPSRMGGGRPLRHQPRPGGNREAGRRRDREGARRRGLPNPGSRGSRPSGCPAAGSTTVAEAFAEPQTAARSMIETVAHSAIGELKLLGAPYKFSATPAARAPARLPCSASTPTKFWASSGWTVRRLLLCGSRR